MLTFSSFIALNEARGLYLLLSQILSRRRPCSLRFLSRDSRNLCKLGFLEHKGILTGSSLHADQTHVKRFIGVENAKQNHF
jgi:hypothetical protein